LLGLISAGARAEDAASFVPRIHAAPDEDGVYYVGPEVSAPRITRAILAQYPVNLSDREIQGMTVMAMVIDAKGLPQHIQVLHQHGGQCDDAAITAVKQSTFEPGMLAGKAVPVWIDVRVVFHANQSPAVPQVLIAERDVALPDASHFVDKRQNPLSYTPPYPIHTVDADFDNPFAVHPLVQMAVVTVQVSAEGLPREVHVRRGLGFGSDEKAIAAVQHYKFLPAMKKGKPIEASREIAVYFSKF